MAIPTSNPSALLELALVQLIREHGKANADWTHAYIEITDEDIVASSLPKLIVTRDAYSRKTTIAVALEPSEEDRALEINDTCLYCREPVYSKTASDRVWLHRSNEASRCPLGVTWARPINNRF